MNKLSEPKSATWHAFLTKVVITEDRMPESDVECQMLCDDLTEMVETYRGYLLPAATAAILGVTVENLDMLRIVCRGPKAHARHGQIYYDSRETIFYANYRDRLPKDFGWYS